MSRMRMACLVFLMISSISSYLRENGIYAWMDRSSQTYRLVFSLRTTRFTSSSSSVSARYGLGTLLNRGAKDDRLCHEINVRFCSRFACRFLCGRGLCLLFIVAAFFARRGVIVEKEFIASHGCSRNDAQSSNESFVRRLSRGK